MERTDFWREVFTVRGTATMLIWMRVTSFVAFALFVCIVNHAFGFNTGMGVAPYEIVGVVLALLLVIRTNSGYDRWYEGRKLWGGIVNQSRNLALIGLTQGPQDRRWREEFIRWTAAFSHACKHSLRGERQLDDMRELIGDEEVKQLAAAEHMPLYVAGKLSRMLNKAVEDGTMDRFSFLQAQQDRCALMDHLGACERIIKTPLARIFSIKIRRFLFLYLTALPLAIIDKAGSLTPLIAFLVAYPLLSLDQIGIELQDPFSLGRLNHLPLNDISHGIQKNLFALLDEFDEPNRPCLESESPVRPRRVTGHTAEAISALDAQVQT